MRVRSTSKLLVSDSTSTSGRSRSLFIASLGPTNVPTAWNRPLTEPVMMASVPEKLRLAVAAAGVAATGATPSP